MILQPRLLATSLRAKRMQDAPSVTWLELPAVVVPFF